MSDLDLARSETLVRLAATRAEIRRLLEPPGPAPGSAPGEEPAARGFPRSRAMQWLMSGRGAGTVGAMAGGMLIARPALAFRLLRRLPTGPMGRLLLLKVISALRKRD